MKKKSYNSLDLGKFVAAVLVVAIHSNPFEYLGMTGGIIRSCLLRLAVPFFFLTSSFLFFSRNPQLPDVRHYVKRILILYAFWAVFSIPLFYIYHTPPYGEPITVSQLIWNFFFSSTYPGSWFLMASLESVLLVWLLSRFLNNSCLFVLCIILYCFSMGVFDEIQSDGLLKYLHDIQGNWAYASIYFCVGKIVADNRNLYNTGKKHIWLVLMVALAVFDVISYLQMIPMGSASHRYLLVPLSTSILLFVLCHEVNYHLPYYTMRKMSTMFYLSHFSFVAMVAFVLHHFIGIDAPMLRYLLVLLCCLLLFVCIQNLSAKKRFCWLKYGI